MATEIGEYIVGAYLKVIKNCDFVGYNIRPPVGGLEGLGEIDVIGMDFNKNEVYMCEAITHITGLLYGSNKKSTMQKIIDKFKRQRDYYEKYLAGKFAKAQYMFWSPRVSKGLITDQLQEIEGLELIINEEYTKCVDELRGKARKMTNDIGNPFFKFLQIMEHLKR